MSNVLKGLLLIAVGIAAGVGYFSLQKSGGLATQGTSVEAYVGQTFPPILFLDAKERSWEKGCYDLKWSSINVNSCVASWRPTVATNGGEKVCLGKGDTEGVRNVGSNVGGITYSVTCTGSAGTVSRAVKVR